MRNQDRRPLALNRETVRSLNAEDLGDAAGGSREPTPPIYASLNTLCRLLSLPNFCPPGTGI